MGWISRAGLFVCISAVGAAIAAPLPAWRWDLPPGVAAPVVPADNPLSPAKVELGRRLFYDADLSIDGTMSCATCHEQHRAFADGNRTHGGVGGAGGRRNVMSLTNVADLMPLTWADPRLTRLEQQVLVPLTGTHPLEMGMGGHDGVLARRLGADSCYRRMFAAAFPGSRIDTQKVTWAIASFERTLLSFDSPFDRFRRGEETAISGQAKSGAKLFEKQCMNCHAGRNYSDGKFHAIGLRPAAHPVTDHGLREVTGRRQDDGAFRTPSLRNVGLTAPYMHDGAIPDLPGAIRGHAMVAGGGLDERDISALVAFLNSLSDRKFISNPNFGLPKTACGKAL